MNFLEVKGTNKDFAECCKKLEDYQYNLIPILKEKDYFLTKNLEEVNGFVLYIDGKVVGSIGLKHVDNDTCEIVRVFIDQNYRGNGYGNKLIEKIEEYAKSKGYKKAEIVAWVKSTSAVCLYKKFNYIVKSEKVSEWFGGDKYLELYKEF